MTKMASNNINSLFAAQVSEAQNSFGTDQDINKSTTQDSKDSRRQEPKKSRKQEVKKARSQESKKSREQEVKRERTQEDKNSSRDDVKTSAGQEGKKSRIIDSDGIKRRPINIMIRDEYYRTIRIMAVHRNVQPWRLIDEALGCYLESENNQKTNSKNSQ